MLSMLLYVIIIENSYNNNYYYYNVQNKVSLTKGSVAHVPKARCSVAQQAKQKEKKEKEKKRKERCGSHERHKTK